MSLSRRLYTLLLFLARPWLRRRLARRALLEEGYAVAVEERFGDYRERRGDVPGALWVHAVSLGETRAAQPLLQALQAQYPDAPILLTHMTATGRAAGREMYGAAVNQCWLPYDYPAAVASFLDHFSPRLCLIMETELWPNLLAACRERGIPVVLANARLSERSAHRYGRWRALVRETLGCVDLVLAQGEADAGRLQQLGARSTQVVGNLKYDVMPSPERVAQGDSWRKGFASRPVWLAASTRQGEEDVVLEAHTRLRTTHPDALLLLVPRHPQRFEAVAAQVAATGFAFRRRSEGVPEAGDAVWLGDSLGEMAAYYQAVDLVVMGGTLLPFGGQNLIEAAASGCALLLGPHTDNFYEAAAGALSSGAAQQVEDAAQLAAAVEALWREPERCRAMVAAGLHFAASRRGAAERSLPLISALLVEK